MEFVPTLRPGGGFGDGLHLGRAFDVHGVGPSVRLVHQIAQAIEGALVPWRRDIEAAPAVQFHPRRAEVQLNPILVCVPDPEAGVAVSIEARKANLLETVDHLLLFVFGRGVVVGEADDASAISPFVRASVDKINHAVRVASHDLRQWLARQGHRLA